MINQFVNDLAHKLDKSSEDILIYLEAFALGFGTELQMFKTAGFEPFGQFKVEKRLEYVDESPEGVKTLYPPVLIAVFMSSAIQGVIKTDENKDSSPLYELFEERYQWSEEAVSLFIAQLKSVLKKHLLNENKAVIPAFGTFEGELGSELLFTPFESFAELINKPFAHFEPTVLNCSAKEIDTPVKSSSQGKASPKEESEGEEASEPEPVKDPVEEAIAAEERRLEMEAKQKDSAETETEAPVIDPEAEKKAVATDSSLLVAAHAAHEKGLAITVPTTTQEGLEHIGALRAELAVYTERYRSSEEKLVYKNQVIKYYRNLSIILGIFLLATLCFWYWSSDFKLIHRDTLPIEESTIESFETHNPGDDPSSAEKLQLPDSTTQITDQDSSNTLQEELELEQVVEDNKVDTIRHSLRSGETLRGLAHKYLGSKDRWPEIVDMNKDKIVDPDRVPVGTVIDIIK